MKKIDKLVLDSFIGPFIITFLVVVFILLNINMLKYFDDIIGKGLEWIVLGQLLFYFAVFTIPTAMPLAVLLSSLITFGNLGEHFELTAIKASGISLVRALQPIFIFVIALTGVAFYANNNLVPKAALEAYSLLYDIKQKKPALDLREGAFYNGIPDISIKVNKKFPDGVTLKEIIIYDHRKNDGNKQVTVADSGKMYTILNERYLKLELFNGYNYSEGTSSEREMAGPKTKSEGESLSRSKFAKTQVVFDLSSFQFERTDKKWFQGNRIMRNISELDEDLDSLNDQVLAQKMNYYLGRPSYFFYYTRNDSLIMPREVYRYKEKEDSVRAAPFRSKATIETLKVDTIKRETLSTMDSVKPRPAKKIENKTLVQRPQKFLAKKTKPKAFPGKMLLVKSNRIELKKNPKITDSLIAHRIDSIFAMAPSNQVVQSASNMVRQVKSQIMNYNTTSSTYEQEVKIFLIQWHQIISNSFACIAMFLIGAPLGAIIKKGGLGVPFLVSIFFFIVFYLLSMQGQKYAKQGSMSVVAGVWEADLILLVIGLFFLKQARADVRLFESDFYMVVIDKMLKRLKRNRSAMNSSTPVR